MQAFWLPVNIFFSIPEGVLFCTNYGFFLLVLFSNSEFAKQREHARSKNAKMCLNAILKIFVC
jgi:hypothetical protein